MDCSRVRLIVKWETFTLFCNTGKITQLKGGNSPIIVVTFYIF